MHVLLLGSAVVAVSVVQDASLVRCVAAVVGVVSPVSRPVVGWNVARSVLLTAKEALFLEALLVDVLFLSILNRRVPHVEFKLRNVEGDE